MKRLIQSEIYNHNEKDKNKDIRESNVKEEG